MGSSTNLADDFAGTNRCVRCGLCLPHCPTYLETWRETSSPRGRIRLMAAVADHTLAVQSPGFEAQMQECLGCRACEDVCPSGVPYGQMLEAARARIAESHAHQPAQTASAAIIGGIFGDMRRFRAAATMVRASQHLGVTRAAEATGLLHALGMEQAAAQLPRIPKIFVVPRGQRIVPAAPTRPPIALFTGCVMSTLLAGTTRATMRVLTRLGHPVSLPMGQQCCGAIATHAGQTDLAQDLARRTIAAFEAEPEAIIINTAAGCGAALKEYGHLLRNDLVWAERAHAFSVRVRDASEVIADDLAAGGDALLHPLPLRVIYQAACHLEHAQRITRAPRQVLKAIPRLEIIDITESSLCCGSAGLYSIINPAMAQALRDRKVSCIRAEESDVVVTTNPGCLMHLRPALRSDLAAPGIMHLIDLLAASLEGLSTEHVLFQARQ
jgi:glycolate oxidase iron-sulfur subunit